MSLKKCTLCGELKPVDDFTVDRQKSSSRSPHCLRCNSSRVRNASTAYAARTDEQIAEDRARLRADGSKWCGGCRDTLPLNAFALSRRTADGLQTRCRACQKVYKSGGAS